MKSDMKLISVNVWSSPARYEQWRYHPTLYTREKHNAGLLRRAIEVEALPESWKSYFQHRLEKLTKIST
jgi:hypothetical protein